MGNCSSIDMKSDKLECGRRENGQSGNLNRIVYVKTGYPSKIKTGTFYKPGNFKGGWFFFFREYTYNFVDRYEK